MDRDELTLRPISGADELELFCRLRYVLDDELADDLAEGRRRPEWMWVALRGERLVGRVAWWCRNAGDAPQLLDIVDVDDDLPAADRLDVGERLLRAAMDGVLARGEKPPEYDRSVPPDWRDSAATRRVVEDRMTLLERVGARLFVERFRLSWAPGTPIAEPSARLTFRPVRGAEELVTLMTRVLEGTLDAHSLDDLSRMSAREAATKHYDEELARHDSPRGWWRVATLPEGEPVGFVVPAHNGYNAIIAYLAVLPEHRGNGYIDDILAEGTRVLAAHNPPRIRASTDLGNVPMAEAFRRAGYAVFAREITMTWS